MKNVQEQQLNVQGLTNVNEEIKEGAKLMALPIRNNMAFCQQKDVEVLMRFCVGLHFTLLYAIKSFSNNF